MGTYSAKPADINRRWFVVDVEGKVLGRAASQIASILKGKLNPRYTPSFDTGDHVVVINAAKVKLTGGKEQKKQYWHHTGHPGGIKSMTAGELRAHRAEDLVINAVRRMLPRNVLGRQMMTKLRVYPDAEHKHQAQQPVEFKVEA
ncbi:MAG TPA: 50S ribosomal protein L13 [Myxococcales bacterium]|jgi:large subunit ribosomal protein L13|nr:50S ribosomal protein L13 [Myxococcales bacterium]